MSRVEQEYGGYANYMPEDKTELQLRQEAAERQRAHIKKQEDWYDSEEYRVARAKWLTGPSCSKDGALFEASEEYAEAKEAYDKRINGGNNG